MSRELRPFSDQQLGGARHAMVNLLDKILRCGGEAREVADMCPRGRIRRGASEGGSDVFDIVVSGGATIADGVSLATDRWVGARVLRGSLRRLRAMLRHRL